MFLSFLKEISFIRGEDVKVYIFSKAACLSPQIDWDHFLYSNRIPLPSPFHLIVLLIIGALQIQRTGVIIILMHLLCVCV